MGKFDEYCEMYKKDMTEKFGMTVDDALLKAVAKACGPSIYSNDAGRVSCSDQTELDRVKNNFLIKKLGLADGAELDQAIKDVCNEMGSSNRNKYRPIFYYMLVKKFNKEAQFA